MFQTIAAVASYFLIVADFSRSTVTAAMAAAAMREAASLRANLSALTSSTTMMALTDEMGITGMGGNGTG
jgi:hypothetical protein